MVSNNIEILWVKSWARSRLRVAQLILWVFPPLHSSVRYYYHHYEPSKLLFIGESRNHLWPNSIPFAWAANFSALASLGKKREKHWWLADWRLSTRSGTTQVTSHLGLSWLSASSEMFMIPWVFRRAWRRPVVSRLLETRATWDAVELQSSYSRLVSEYESVAVSVYQDIGSDVSRLPSQSLMEQFVHFSRLIWIP